MSDVDSIFYLFLLVAIVNLVGNAVKRAKSKEDSSRRPGRARSTMRSRPARGQSGLEKARSGEAKAGLPESPAHLSGAEVESGCRPAALPRRKALKRAVPKNLERIFREEDQLVAAFIFHEILGPPRSVRHR